MAIYGYARVSTKKQGKDGNSLEAQEQAIHEKYPECKIYSEAFTGTKFERKKFLELVDKLQADDVLVVTKLDRFCRNTREGLAWLEKLLAMGVSVHILNMGLIDNTPTGKLITTIFLAFAEFERAMIIERTTEGKEIARQNPDYREGRPIKYKRKQIEHALSLLDVYSYRQVSEVTGISVSTLTRAKRKETLGNHK